MTRRLSTGSTFPLRVVDVGRRPGELLLRACGSFGIVLRRRRRSRPDVLPDVRALGRRVRRSRVVLLQGPSGAGKSTLLRGLLRELGPGAVHARVDARVPDPSPAAILDRLPGSLSRRLTILAMAGLAEATLLVRSEAELSHGQHCRFVLAAAMARADRRQARWLVADEFASALDRVTARALSATLVRWVRSRSVPITALLATAHDDLVQALAPDLVIRIELNGSWDVADATIRGDHSTSTGEIGHDACTKGKAHGARRGGRPPRRAGRTRTDL